MRFNIFSELCSVFFLWCTWAELFSFIPHGHPYAAIFLLMAIALALAISIRAKKESPMRTSFGDQYERIELYRRVQNV